MKEVTHWAACDACNWRSDEVPTLEDAIEAGTRHDLERHRGSRTATYGSSAGTTQG